ncbi:hypothetical protein LOTGIDRAFT_160273 [Lottia gigantea]|uniref:Uncharacterized protein n=1 Tax=Lottia gigantea TaxID=225164 RepID=V4APZ8_LOTGI|nr:hypothetical protein LOTGIDRAFT_160273 [Lottia gigantea]ESO95726.1 hypothetical protein LOTGIDRAFT_160273 [Lottia gigantea]
MWLSIKVVLVLGILIGSDCFAESDEIKININPESVANDNEKNPKSSIISDSGHITSDNRGSDAKIITFSENGLSESDNEASDSRVMEYIDKRGSDATAITFSENGPSEIDNDGSDGTTITFGESSRTASDNRDSEDEIIPFSHNGRSDGGSDRNQRSDNNGQTMKWSDSDSELSQIYSEAIHYLTMIRLWYDAKLIGAKVDGIVCD